MTFEVQPYRWISVFIDCQCCGCVFDKHLKHSSVDVVNFWHRIGYEMCDEMKSTASLGQRYFALIKKHGRKFQRTSKRIAKFSQRLMVLFEAGSEKIRATEL